MKDYMKVMFKLKTKKEEELWRSFFNKYFMAPNYKHQNHNKEFINNYIIVDERGFVVCIDIYMSWVAGNYKYIEGFEEFKDTLLYQKIVNRKEKKHKKQLRKQRRKKNEII